MSKGTAAVAEDFSEVERLEALNLQAIRPLKPEWRSALVKRVQQFRILSGRDAIIGVRAPLPSLMSYLSVEETSTSFVVLIAESEVGILGNSAPGLLIFPQTELLDDLVEVPTEVGKRHEPVIRGKGVPVWVLVSYITKRHMSPAEVSRLWNGYITDQEVRAALAYWQAHPEDIEDKLSEAG